MHSSTWTLVFETAWWPFLWLPHIGGAAAYEFAIFDQLFLETSWAHLWRRDARQGYQIWFFNWFSPQFWAFFEREIAHSDHDFTVFYCRSLQETQRLGQNQKDSSSHRNQGYGSNCIWESIYYSRMNWLQIQPDTIIMDLISFESTILKWNKRISVF